MQWVVRATRRAAAAATVPQDHLMVIAPPTPDERQRLALLRALELLDSAPEPAFDTLTRLVSRLLQVPVALVSLVDENRQWFKSRVGLDALETPRDLAFCAHAIHHDAPFVVPDALLDHRFADNPLVTGAPHVRAYAGIPLRTTSANSCSRARSCAARSSTAR
jgi:GAF domain-containing protein